MSHLHLNLKRTLLGILCLAALAGCANPAPVNDSEAVTLADLMSGLEGLPADRFMAEAYERLILRTPEQVTVLGLADLYDSRDDRLNSYALEHLLLTQSFEAALLQQAQTYDLEALPADVRLDLEVFLWYLGDRVAGHPFQWFENHLLDERGYLVNQYAYLLLVQQPFQDEADVKDYVSRLAAVGPQVDEIIAYLRQQDEAGIRMPYEVYVAVMEELGAHKWQVGRKTPFVRVLAVRLQSFDVLSQEKRQDYFDQASEIADAVILPAFERLMAYLYTRAEITAESPGLHAQPDGDLYYAYRLNLASTLDLTPAEVHALGLAAVADLQSQVRTVAAEMGYDASLPLQEIFRQATVDRNYALGLDIFATLRSLLMDVEEGMDSVFHYDIDKDLVMVPVIEGGFYEPGGLDGVRRPAFYAGFAGREAHFDMPTMVYHETFPGRHFLHAVIQTLDLPVYRQAMHFPAFDAGWAQYAEFLAWEMGMYDDDPNANLGRLQYALLRAAQLVVDTGIHAMGWDAQAAARYLVDAAGVDRSEANEIVLVQIAQPGNAVAAYLGYAEIIRLRETAAAELGTAFDIQDFHDAILGAGNVPLPILEEQVWQYINSGKK
jgi:uncharacterized protein (DUF885 family)